LAEQHKAQAELAQAYKEIFLYSPQGKAILLDLIKVSGILTISGQRDSADLQHMHGSQDMVRRILSILAIDEDKLVSLSIGEEINGE
tara:strand:- start:26685 stop:26945 length:261 start_codon:yes stop_codon:yes gene_type:complete